MKSYNIITYGCQMNAHESEKLAYILESKGYIPANGNDDADIIIFNTCCVRENAERKAFGNIGKLKALKAEKPELIIAVCGCMTQQEGVSDKLIKKFPFLDVVFGTFNIDSFWDYLKERDKRGKSVVEVLAHENAVSEEHGYKREGTVHAFVNIMYGCNNFCTYCIVPHVRGRERSRSEDAIIGEVKSLLESGYREITLLGQNVNSYGHDLGGPGSFAALLDKLGALPYKCRIKFMTSHPKDLSVEVVETISRHKNLSKNIHLPIQSGSNEILGRMNRRYTREHYLKLVEIIRQKLEGCGLTTDLMIGFPGETEADFEQTMDIVRQVRFSGAFTFVYSPRSGTPAAKFPDQLDDDTLKRRIIRLVELQNSITSEINAEYVGNVFEVLVDGKDSKREGCMCGRTESGKLVSFEGKEELLGKFVNIKINRSSMASLQGELA